MTKTVLVLHAHPHPRSLTRHLATAASAELAAAGHRVLESDLYGMGWKAVFDGDDFRDRQDTERLSFISESGHAFTTGTQTADVQAEQEKLIAADAIVMQFPLWWFTAPAIVKGWIDRVFAFGFAYGYKGAGNRYRYGEGGLAGKRALLSVTVGGPEVDYGPRGINGPLEQLLFHITHGTLFFAGFDVMPTYAVYDAVGLEDASAATRGLATRLAGLFTDTPIPFRRQNDGDYPDRHTLGLHVATSLVGIDAHRR
ncbi:MAG TPA: NAD(P)H-dependent oxidoreductase [Kofleriaceae bacterium]